MGYLQLLPHEQAPVSVNMLRRFFFFLPPLLASLVAVLLLLLPEPDPLLASPLPLGLRPFRFRFVAQLTVQVVPCTTTDPAHFWTAATASSTVPYSDMVVLMASHSVPPGMLGSEPH